jgi:hypothetical protein
MHQGVIGSVSVRVVLGSDSDLDGLPDDYERARTCLDPIRVDSGDDPDGDGVTTVAEFLAGSEPCIADTDGDGLDDGTELGSRLNPSVPDSDGDGLLDGDEVTRGCDPLNRDGDADGLPDGVEVRLAGDCTDASPLADNDGDGLINLDEVQLFTDPANPDTDDDGLLDGAEVLAGTDPLVADGAPPVTVNLADLSQFALNGRAAGANSPPVVVGGQPVLRIADFGCTSGSAFLTRTIRLREDLRDSVFSTHFLFQLGGGDGGDGLTFTFARSPFSLGSSGGFLGYHGIGPSLAVEFDTFNNGGGFGDSDASHVGIDINGNIASVVARFVPGPLDNGAVWYVWIDYDGPTLTLQLRISQSPLRPTEPYLSYTVDLPTLLGQDEAFMGFTAGTCAATNTHDIRYWNYRNSLGPGPSSSFP